MNRLVIFFLPLFFLGGCLCAPEYCRYPDLFHPGHLDEQQERAKQYDPYTRSDVGPKIVGDRPSGAMDQTPAPQQNFYSKSR